MPFRKINISEDDIIQHTHKSPLRNVFFFIINLVGIWTRNK